MGPYRTPVRRAPATWWRRLRCAWGFHTRELVRIEVHRAYDVWHHECPHCGEMGEVVPDCPAGCQHCVEIIAAMHARAALKCDP